MTDLHDRLTANPPPDEKVKSPHRQAAFINAIREEGSKREACDYLQETWNDLWQARDLLAAMTADRAALVEALEWYAEMMASPTAAAMISLDADDGYRARAALAAAKETPMTEPQKPLPPGQWCTCGLPHMTGGPCWECRKKGDTA